MEKILLGSFQTNRSDDKRDLQLLPILKVKRQVCSFRISFHLLFSDARKKPQRTLGQTKLEGKSYSKKFSFAELAPLLSEN